MRRALAAMKGRYDQERTLDDLIETQVRALRDADAAKASGAASPTATKPAKKRQAPSTGGAARNGTNASNGSNGGSKRGKGRS
jgi:hypothetical protein